MKIKLEWKSLLIKMIPFTLGILIGVGVTKGWKFLPYLLGGYFLGMIIFEFIMMSINEKKAIANEMNLPQEKNTIADTVIYGTGKGIKQGNALYDKGMNFLIPITLLGILAYVIFLITKKQYDSSIMMFGFFVVILLIKDIRREKREESYVSVQ